MLCQPCLQRHSFPTSTRRNTPTANNPRKQDRHPHKSSSQQLEGFFISALVQAGQCSGSSFCRSVGSLQGRLFGTYTTNARPARRQPQPAGLRTLHSLAARQDEVSAVAAYEVTKEDYRSLVPQYYTQECDRVSVNPLVLSQDIVQETQSAQDVEINLSRKMNVHNNPTLVKMIELLNEEDPSHEQLFKLYEELPSPRPAHLPRRVLRKLLHHLSVVEYKSEVGMRRYLTVFQNVKDSKKYLTLSEWASAISFAGRHVKRVSATQVEAALRLWKEMENSAHSSGNDVVFSTLFDIASKGHKFVLADMILSEMATRAISPTRHHRINLIYHAGLRRDGQAVRAAYSAYVDAGEFVDGAVVACVVASLLHCGESVAAEQVFFRARALYEEKLQDSAPYRLSGITATTHWRTKRSYGLELGKAAAAFRQRLQQQEQKPPGATAGTTNTDASNSDDDGGGGTLAAERAAYEARVSLAPDIAAYNALMYHHAVTAGDFDRVTALLADMATRDISLRGVLFLHLFRGFANHGGVLYTAWTRRQLERTWATFCDALDAEATAAAARNAPVADAAEEDAGVPLSRGLTPRYSMHMSAAMARAALRAFSKVAGRERAAAVWQEMLQPQQQERHWRPTDRERADVEALLEALAASEGGWRRGGSDRGGEWSAGGGVRHGDDDDEYGEDADDGNDTDGGGAGGGGGGGRSKMGADNGSSAP